MGKLLFSMLIGALVLVVATDDSARAMSSSAFAQASSVVGVVHK